MSELLHEVDTSGKPGTGESDRICYHHECIFVNLEKNPNACIFSKLKTYLWIKLPWELTRKFPNGMHCIRKHDVGPTVTKQDSEKGE